MTSQKEHTSNNAIKDSQKIRWDIFIEEAQYNDNVIHRRNLGQAKWPVTKSQVIGTYKFKI